MKQHINPDNLRELSKDAQNRLFEWWIDEHEDRGGLYYSLEDRVLAEKNGQAYKGSVVQGYNGLKEDFPCDLPGDGNSGDRNKVLPLLSIGQMIEFLIEHNENREYLDSDYEYAFTFVSKGEEDVDPQYYGAGIGWKGEELCDALWEAVKNILES